ncbi:hypothetical protein Tco_1197868 [Tanacetum coccineum]
MAGISRPPPYLISSSWILTSNVLLYCPHFLRAPLYISSRSAGCDCLRAPRSVPSLAFFGIIVLDSEYHDVLEHPSKLTIGCSSCHNTPGGLRQTRAHLDLVELADVGWLGAGCS